MKWMSTLEAAWAVRRTNAQEALAICDGLIQEAQSATNPQVPFEDLEACVNAIRGLIAIYRSDYAEAHTLLGKVLERLSSGHLPLWLARTLNARGYLYAVKGQFGEALVDFREALDWSKAGDYYDLCVFILFNIGELYREALDRLDEARFYYQEALAFAQLNKGHVLLSSIYSNLSSAEYRFGDLDTALSYAENAVAIAKQSEDAYALGICYEMLSGFYLDLKDLDLAWHYTDLAMQHRNTISDTYANASTWLQKGRIAFARGDFQGAVTWGKMALQASARLLSRGTIAAAMELLARSFENLGDCQHAMLYYKAYSKKSLEKFTLDLATQMSIMSSEAKFREIKKDAEIHRLRNVELKAKSEEIERVVHELEAALESLKATQNQLMLAERMAAIGRLVAGVAHEINTPLGVSITLASFLESHQQELKTLLSTRNLLDYHLEEHFEASQDAVASMERSLQRVADIVRSFKNLSMGPEMLQRQRVQIQSLAEDFKAYIELKYKEDALNLEIECQDMVVDTCPEALKAIWTELAHNTIDHGHIEGGKVSARLTLELDGHHCRMMWQDSGKGSGVDNPLTLFDPFVSSKRNEGHLGLGLHSVFNIVKQILKGEIEIITGENQGFQVAIVCPLKE